MERFSMEALEFEQRKQEALLEVANGRKMEAGEVREFLSGVDGEIKALNETLDEKKAELKSIEDKAEKEETQSIIDELERQIASLGEIDEEDEFTVRQLL